MADHTDNPLRAGIKALEEVVRPSSVGRPPASRALWAPGNSITRSVNVR